MIASGMTRRPMSGDKEKEDGRDADTPASAGPARSIFVLASRFRRL